MQSTVLSCLELRPGAYDLQVRLSEPVPTSAAGQFAHIRCGDAHLLRRPISLCDCWDDVARFVFEVKGSGTAWLARRRPGDLLDLLFPLGRGFDTVTPDEPLLLVGGGIGVPPLLYAARLAAGRSHAVLGFRTAQLALLTADLHALCEQVHICSDDGTAGEPALVDAVCRRLLCNQTYKRILACGPKPMLRAVAAVAAACGVPCQVSLEERMACGIGACLGCACQTVDEAGQAHYSHVCADGPVFDAGGVLWA